MSLMFTRQNLLELFFIYQLTMLFRDIYNFLKLSFSFHVNSCFRTFRNTLLTFFFRFLYWNFQTRIWWPLVYRYRNFAIFLLIGSEKCHENIFLLLPLFCSLSLKTIKSVLLFMENNFTQNELSQSWKNWLLS